MRLSSYMGSTLSAGDIAIISFSTEDSDDPHLNGAQSVDRNFISFVLLNRGRQVLMLVEVEAHILAELR